jgi:hypothetical protein
MNECWTRRYEPITEIDKKWYSLVLEPIFMAKWIQTIKELPKNKATGLSKILNEMLQHMGDNILEATLKLINMYLIVKDIPVEWRDALLYPIPKTMDWKNNFDKNSSYNSFRNYA